MDSQDGHRSARHPGAPDSSRGTPAASGGEEEVDVPPAAAAGDALPELTEAGGMRGPAPPAKVADVGIEPPLLLGLILKLAYSVPRFTTEWAADQLQLHTRVIDELCWSLREDNLLEVLGQIGPRHYRYAATDRGRDQARRWLEISPYVGPAPVSLSHYCRFLSWQLVTIPEPTLADVERALAPLVLPRTAVDVAALAAISGRSLFLFGPPGNGKTALGHLLHDALRGELWIPFAIGTGSAVIRLFDPHAHQQIPLPDSARAAFDARWVRIRRPFGFAAGEMTLDDLDLAYASSLHIYEAPPHLKANGGTFLIDDLGRQRAEPQQILNRWIHPLESRVDHLTLRTGERIRVPFRLLLIVATNLDVARVTDPAFLRRMGYRLAIGRPTPQAYAAIFRRCAADAGMNATPALIDDLLRRYRTESREMSAAEPHDLIERVKDICRLRDAPPTLDEELVDLAWRSYFGLA